MSRNTADTDRHHGGPGSSHQNADQDVDGPRQPDEKQPKPGEPTNRPLSNISGGGGERDRHHTHDPKTKS